MNTDTPKIQRVFPITTSKSHPGSLVVFRSKNGMYSSRIVSKPRYVYIYLFYFSFIFTLF